MYIVLLDVNNSNKWQLYFAMSPGKQTNGDFVDKFLVVRKKMLRRVTWEPLGELSDEQGNV